MNGRKRGGYKNGDYGYRGSEMLWFNRSFSTTKEITKTREFPPKNLQKLRFGRSLNASEFSGCPDKPTLFPIVFLTTNQISAY